MFEPPDNPPILASLEYVESIIHTWTDVKNQQVELAEDLKFNLRPDYLDEKAMIQNIKALLEYSLTIARKAESMSELLSATNEEPAKE